MANNPFSFGAPVKGDQFVDREEEIEELASDLISGQNVIMMSERRLGKSSLIKELFGRIEEECIPVYVEMYDVMTTRRLIKRISSAVADSAYSKLDEIVEKTKDLLSSWRPRVTIEQDKVTVDPLARADESEGSDISSIFDFPQRIAEDKDEQVVVAYDEFQEIRELNGDEMEKMMRSRIQHHGDVSYLFTGSKKSMMTDMFANPNRPFYESGKHFDLGEIPRDEFAEFIREKMSSTDREIADGAVEEVLAFTNGHPYHTQQLCQEVWRLSTDITEADVQQAKENIVSRRSDRFEEIFVSCTANQRKLLLGIATSPENPEIYSQAFCEEFGLKRGTVTEVEDSLEKKSLIYGRRILNVFFEKWLQSSLG